ncbi:Lnb N-terminal periplasmic domain-containing protein [Anaeromyxobacter oryzae]|uniref:DUF4105 domain-containing protein n=1 Tax=Anaeromyxobacter oryzae TaxID=2918170 RepID=A0ABM7WVN1_9BACT|nr:DUF4105 domain-containing protein [Anaeromyxobacter oryzae]BDG03567.1 hypothetical protein AMOR_25630 [Anaeromyxobacter oryzae]
MRRVLLTVLLAAPLAGARAEVDAASAGAAGSAADASATASAVAAPDPTYLQELVARARALRLAEDPGWLRLGRWRPRLLGGWKSEVDGRAFFRAPHGQTDPAAELEATLAGFLDATKVQDELDDAQCRFPARLLFLDARLGLDPRRLPRRACPRRDEFLGRVEPVGATLVFSSFYLNNPASAFGHTLLRLDKAPEARSGKHYELLDYGVDYAATVDTGNAILYAVKGLFGLFKGEFKYYAYYYKVRQYGDYESRDLWEYDLDLSPQEVKLLAAHVWELGGTWFQYWYLDENCSYHVLGALEAAAPRLHLLDHVNPWVVLPSDTVKALYANAGLVRRVHYRPSVRTQFEARARDLDARALAAVAALADTPGASLPDVAPAEQARILDAAADLVDLRHFRELLQGANPEAARLRQALLERRAALGVPSAPLEIPTPEQLRPDRGHGSFRLGLGGGAARDDGGTVALDFRLALHDLGDPPDGEPPLANIEFLPTRLVWSPAAGRLDIDDTSLVRVISLNPVNRFDTRPSWRMRVGATTVHDGGCDHCLAGAAELGGGFAAADLAGALDLLATADTELLVSPRLSGAGGSWLRPGIGPSLLARLRLGRAAVLLGDARWRVLPGAEPRTTWSLSAGLRLNVVRDLSLAVESRWTPRDAALTALVLAYF